MDAGDDFKLIWGRNHGWLLIHWHYEYILCFEYQACQEVSCKIIFLEHIQSDKLALEQAQGEQRLSVLKASK